jgi:molybdopterin-guanine dinucleotide biosynthesis protein A
LDRSVTHPDIAVVVLAGGQATRLGGGDKCRRLISGTSIIDRVIAALRPQTNLLLLSANGPPERFSDLGLTVIGDGETELQGPLGGLLSAMSWIAENAPSITGLVSAPADSPFLPADLVDRLQAAATQGPGEIAMASSGGRKHPVAALWPLGLRDALAETLAAPGSRSVLKFANRFKVVTEEFSVDPVDPFFNVNTPEDLAAAEKLAQL